MKVILREKIENLGNIGDVIEVKVGYARNFLIPKGLALETNPKNLRILEQEKRMKEAAKKREKEKTIALAQKLKEISCTVRVKAGEDDRIFGSVTPLDIKKALDSQGIDIDKRNISIEENIKTLGIYHALIRLHPEVETKIKVWVVKE
ncbi:50S ribosomal protein L9 [bacterium]|nr:50S ribosomal protein L9 [bacterium]MBU4561174.1 50S ribosomal protein L9 [bacterium]MCG2676524.1 50S ribosomal protein L9 [bacterium]MCG2678017.1 50S ribosomal protein L9 [bacterium]